jgi:tRNA-splicing ligase RtcB
MPTHIRDVLSWASDVDEGTIEQAQKAARLPFVMKPLALMADAHVGKGATVGSVIVTEGAIIPAAVGVDIGCGMIAAETRFTSHDLPDDLTDLHAKIAAAIPAGMGQGHEFAATSPLSGFEIEAATEFSAAQVSTARKQFGSLGSGNHFVEVCLDERDRVWFVLHSGSRGIGNQLATMHIEKAQGLMRAWFIELEDPDLAYLVEGDPHFDAYISDMLWAQEYARHNREQMLTALESVVRQHLGVEDFITDTINCHHNFTQREHQRHRDVWVTRKGAIQAFEGSRGVIPGSMGTKSYIVTGLGNPASYFSSSHGAGRRMSRAQARKNLTVDSLNEAMTGRAWNSDHANALIDEHPLAYKDIDQVMDDQKDLVHIDHTLSQILNYKGTK